MADVTNINPLKPMWPTRPDDRGSGKEKKKEETDKKNEQPENNNPESPKGDNDGHIDEYV